MFTHCSWSVDSERLSKLLRMRIIYACTEETLQGCFDFEIILGQIFFKIYEVFGNRQKVVQEGVEKGHVHSQPTQTHTV